MEKLKNINLTPKTMQSINFLYWLQGLFEISEITRLSSRQVEVIKAHLKITVKDHPFISWLEGFLETQTKGINKELTLVLKEKLALSFTNITAPKNPLEEILKQPQRSPYEPIREFPHLPWNPSGPIFC